MTPVDVFRKKAHENGTGERLEGDIMGCSGKPDAFEKTPGVYKILSLLARYCNDAKLGGRGIGSGVTLADENGETDSFENGHYWPMGKETKKHLNRCRQLKCFDEKTTSLAPIFFTRPRQMREKEFVKFFIAKHDSFVSSAHVREARHIWAIKHAGKGSP